MSDECFAGYSGPGDLRIIAQNDEDAEKIRKMGFKKTAAFETGLLTIGGYDPQDKSDPR